MRLSLAWIFDHIDADWQQIDIKTLVNSFNKTTAEIEKYERIFIDLSHLAVGRLIAADTTFLVEVAEWNETIQLPARDHATIGQFYFIYKNQQQFSWARLEHFGASKEGIMPAISIPTASLPGDWKKKFAVNDIILDLDNKSINHRPDMWCHRGVAREIAAILHLPFKALDHLLVAHPSKEFDQQSKDTDFAITVEDATQCKRFAGLYFEYIESASSNILVACRLAKVDSKPINALVDATNYVMLDIGQPMHAFDAETFSKKAIVVRAATRNEAITLLDEQIVALQETDCVITDGKNPLALAGIMGGTTTAVTSATRSLFLEAACFNPATIRKTSARIKKRTEASARFEKSLDPVLAPVAIQRFLKLLADASLTYTSNGPIIIIGTTPIPNEITMSHSFIENILGVSLDSSFVLSVLEKLEFRVSYNKGQYTIIIPSFRATKDINIKEDIVEEIGRFYGYDAIKPQLPMRKTRPFSLHETLRMRQIKQFCAYTLNMKEVYSYAFFDESFLSWIDWQPAKALQVQEAVSQNWQRLVTTLMPNLFKMVHAHADQYDVMNFFECAAIWPIDGNAIQEQSCLAGIFVDQKKETDFYIFKQKLDALAHLIDVHFDWQPVDTKLLLPWYMPYQSAILKVGDQVIGMAGMANPAFFSKIAQGTAFIFEFNADFLRTFTAPLQQYKPASKYPNIVRDVSVLMPLSSTVKQLRNTLHMLDKRIRRVDLVDFFQKPEWDNQKSLTFRITLNDEQTTMTDQEAQKIMGIIEDRLKDQGGNIR